MANESTTSNKLIKDTLALVSGRRVVRTAKIIQDSFACKSSGKLNADGYVVMNNPDCGNNSSTNSDVSRKTRRQDGLKSGIDTKGKLKRRSTRRLEENRSARAKKLGASRGFSGGSSGKCELVRAVSWFSADSGAPIPGMTLRSGRVLPAQAPNLPGALNTDMLNAVMNIIIHGSYGDQTIGSLALPSQMSALLDGDSGNISNIIQAIGRPTLLGNQHPDAGRPNFLTGGATAALAAFGGVQQMMQQNPEMVQNAMEMVQQNPQMVQQMMQQNPQMAQQNPQMAQKAMKMMQKNPEMVQKVMEMVQMQGGGGVGGAAPVNDGYVGSNLYYMDAIIATALTAYGLWGLYPAAAAAAAAAGAAPAAPAAAPAAAVAETTLWGMMSSTAGPSAITRSSCLQASQNSLTSISEVQRICITQIQSNMYSLMRMIVGETLHGANEFVVFFQSFVLGVISIFQTGDFQAATMVVGQAWSKMCQLGGFAILWWSGGRSAVGSVARGAANLFNKIWGLVVFCFNKLSEPAFRAGGGMIRPIREAGGNGIMILYTALGQKIFGLEGNGDVMDTAMKTTLPAEPQVITDPGVLVTALAAGNLRIVDSQVLVGEGGGVAIANIVDGVFVPVAADTAVAADAAPGGGGLRALMWNKPSCYKRKRKSKKRRKIKHSRKGKKHNRRSARKRSKRKRK
jgi:hypothetical protein